MAQILPFPNKEEAEAAEKAQKELLEHLLALGFNIHSIEELKEELSK